MFTRLFASLSLVISDPTCFCLLQHCDSSERITAPDMSSGCVAWQPRGGKAVCVRLDPLLLAATADPLVGPGPAPGGGAAAAEDARSGVTA